MRVKLRGWRRTIELVPWEEDEPGGLFNLDDPGLTLLELRSLMAEDPGVAASLRVMLFEVVGFASVAELDDAALCGRVLAAIERGRLRVRVEPYAPMASDAVEEREPTMLVEYANSDFDDHWVEIELLDDEDQPVVGERCRIVLPDDREVFSQTNHNGLIRVDRCVAGQCQIYFPDLDAGAIAPLVEYDDWIEVELLDEQDQPAVGERCRIVLPDGREVFSRTDRNGLVRVERCIAGQCQIYFPDLDAGVIAPRK